MAAFLRLDGVTTDTWLVINPTLKYGLTPNVDVEANFSPLEIVRTHDNASGSSQTLTGVSDLYLRLKYEFLNTDGGNLQATILPYIKAPTARTGIGNGAVEGGLILPVNYKLNDQLTLTTVPEIDFFKDAIGDGRHVNTVQLINLGIALPDNFTLYGELWGRLEFRSVGHDQPIFGRHGARLWRHPLSADRRWPQFRAQPLYARGAGLYRHRPKILMHRSGSKRKMESGTFKSLPAFWFST